MSTTGRERFLKKLLSMSLMLSEFAHELESLAEDIRTKGELDAVAKSSLDQIYGEARLKDGPRRVLEFIRKQKVVQRSTISQRFSASFNSKTLYGPGGIVEELLEHKLIEMKVVPGMGRHAIAYTIPVETALQAFHSSSPKEDLEEEEIDNRPEMSSSMADDLMKAGVRDDFEEVSRRLKEKHLSSFDGGVLDFTNAPDMVEED